MKLSKRHPVHAQLEGGKVEGDQKRVADGSRGGTRAENDDEL